MSSNFQIEYSCTEAEMKEAQSLNQHYQMGGGPKWRSGLLIGVTLVGLILLTYFRFRHEIPLSQQPYFLALFVVIFFIILIKNRITRKKSADPVRMEISEQGMTTIAGDKRVLLRWSGFSKCLESPNLFVMLDRPERVMWVLPKRAFPDADSQDWFRFQANQRPSQSELPAEETALSEKALPPDAIVLNYRLGFRDYLSRMMSSWRAKGFALFIFSLMTVICIVQAFGSDTPGVNSPAKVYFVYMLPTLAVMTPVVFLIVTLVTWLSEKKHLRPQKLVLAEEGISFSDEAASGVLGWDTFAYYLENRWSYFIWQARGHAWHMFPKRAFASAHEVELCRSMLRRHLRQSRWFFK